MNKVAIIGYGWVGKAMHTLFPDAVIYSPGVVRDSDGNYVEGRLDQWNIDQANIKEAVNICDIAFVCVPTPCPNKSKLDTRTVEEVVAWLETDLIVIRSTVNPGDCDFLTQKYHKRICMQPEYLGETPNHPMTDQLTRPFLVIGGNWKDREKLINLYFTVLNANTKIRELTNYAAEIVKLTENRAIAYRVAEAQELYDVCQAHDLPYYTIREVVYGDDPRMNLWWTAIYPDKRGFNSKCIPKDVYAWCAWAESSGFSPELTKAVLEANEVLINPPAIIEESGTFSKEDEAKVNRKAI